MAGKIEKLVLDIEAEVIEIVRRYQATLEQIRALQLEKPTMGDDGLDYNLGRADGRYDAAQIADAAIRGQGQGKEGE